MKTEKKILGFQKNIFYMGLLSFFSDMSSEMIYPLLPIFLTSVLNAPVSFVGLVEGIAESTASITKLFSGWVSDRVNKRKAFISFGYTLSSLLRPLVAFAIFPWHVLAARFADRLGKGIRTAPRDALIADTCKVEERGKAFGFNRALDNAGSVAGPLIAVFILTYIAKDYRRVFILSYLPAIVAAAISLFLITERKAQQPSVSKTFKLRLNSFDSNFKSFLAIIVLFTLGNSSDAFLLLRAKDAGLSMAALPMIWILLNIVKTISSIPGGLLSDKVGRKKLIVAGWIIYFLAYIGFAFARTPAHIWLLFAFYGLFFGATESVEKAFVADLVKVEFRGSAYGVYNCTIGIAALPSSIIMGLLWQKYGPEVAFSFGATAALLASFLLMFFVRERKLVAADNATA